MLNPELSGSQLIWREGALTRTRGRTAPASSTRTDYLKSAIYVVDTTNRPFRWHLPQPVPDMELIERFQADGMTDYFVMPLPFQDATRTSTMSFASTRRADSPTSISSGCRLAARIWSSVAERWVLRHIALDLLAHYLGRVPAERVYAGQIERGDVTRIEAAILICDLRGFTAMTDRAQHGEIVSAAQSLVRGDRRRDRRASRRHPEIHGRRIARGVSAGGEPRRDLRPRAGRGARGASRRPMR